MAKSGKKKVDLRKRAARLAEREKKKRQLERVKKAAKEVTKKPEVIPNPKARPTISIPPRPKPKPGSGLDKAIKRRERVEPSTRTFAKKRSKKKRRGGLA